MDLSPSEQRALQAEKRAAWRQARLKSLEQVKTCKINTHITCRLDSVQGQVNKLVIIICKCYSQDALQAQMVLNRMSEIIDSPTTPTSSTSDLRAPAIPRNSNVNRSNSPSVTVQQFRTSSPQLDNTSTHVSAEADQDNNVKIKIVSATHILKTA